MRATLAIAFLLCTLIVAGNLDAFENTGNASPLPSVGAVLPSAPLAFDWSANDARTVAASLPRTAHTVRANPSPVPVKVWTCNAPRGLDSDASATVRVCEYR